MIENKVQRSQSRPGVATQPTLDPDYTVGKYGNISSQINIKRQPTQSNILKCFFDQQNTGAGIFTFLTQERSNFFGIIFIQEQ